MRSSKAFVLRLAVAAMMVLSAPLCWAGPFDDWAYRTRVQLDNASGTEILTDFPLLVSLDAGNFDFGKAGSDGSDLRVADSGGNALSYEIETWDAVARRAAVWVKVPQIDPGSTAGFVDLFHGNSLASDAQMPADVWSNGYKGVWHLDGSGTAFDSTGRHDGAVVGTGVTSTPGIAGDARAFSTANGRIVARSEDLGPGLSSLDAADDITISYWMKGAAADQPGGYTRVAGKNVDGQPGWEYQRNNQGANQAVRIDTSAANNQVRTVGNGAFDGDWHFIGTTLSGGAVRGYLDDGAPTASGYNVGGGFGNTQSLHIGSRVGGGSQFAGMIDEFRFSDVARSEAWMNAEYRSQTGQLASVTGTILAQGRVAEYSHEDSGNRLLDTTGNGFDATAGGGGGGPSFVAATDPQGFDVGLGTTAGEYVRSSGQFLDVPGAVLDPAAIDPSVGFTFTALVRGEGLVAGTGHETILSSNRFRFQRGNADQLLIQANRTAGGTDLVQAPANSFSPDTWYMAAMRYDAAGNRADAYLIPSTAVLAGPSLSLTPTDAMTDLAALRIGGDGLSGIGGFDGWNGRIDNARFYSGALSKRGLRDVFYSYNGFAGGPIGKVAQYGHEAAANRLQDDTGHGLDLSNAGGVTFVDAAPTGPGDFDLGDTVAQFSGAGNSQLNVPQLYTAGDDFTFVTMVQVDSEPGFQTILSSDRFRLQYFPAGASDDGQGALRLDVNNPTEYAESAKGTFNPGAWHLVAMTYDAETKSIESYVQPDSPVFFGPAISKVAGGAGGLDDMVRFQLGYNGLSGIGGPDPLQGLLDGARFYDQAFTKAELREIFREYRPSTPTTIGLVAQYSHEAADPLADDTGHLATLVNRGGTEFVSTAAARSSSIPRRPTPATSRWATWWAGTTGRATTG